MNNINITHHKKVCQVFANFQPIEINVSNPIFDLLNKSFYQERVLEDRKGCYMPIAFPTGVGKTYNTLLLILKVLLEDIKNEVILGENYKPRYCYYITNSVDNVFDAFNSLIKSIDDIDYLDQAQKDIVKERVLYAPANSRSLLDMLNNNERALDELLEIFSITKNISLLKEIKSLKNELTILATLKDPMHKKILSERLDESAQKCYSAIVRYIQQIQVSDNPVYLNEKNINLLKLLIPGVTLETGITRVVFMTTKKFLYGLQQTVGKFHPTRELTDQILIIDEVDRQQQEILTHLIAANQIDLLATIRTIHSNMKEHQLCSKLQYDGIAQLFEPYLKEIQKFFEQNQLRHSFDIHQSLTKQKKQVLLFSDKLTTHNTNVNGSLKFSFNEKHQQHEIALRQHFKEREEHDFPKFVGKLERLVNREFQYLVRAAEELYRKNLSKLPLDQPTRNLTSTQAIASILDQLNLHALQGQLNQHLNYLVGHQRSDRKSAANFHTRGIKMTEIDRLPESLDSVMFKHHGFNVSPTGMLASWVESGCNILGISATAECGSVIHNFDIRYLRENLGDQYIVLNELQREIIHKYYLSERNYAREAVRISILSIDHNRNNIKDLIRQWNPQIRVEKVFYKQLLGCEDKKIDFNLKWLGKLCQAIASFTDTTNNRYMVGMLNRSLRESLIPFLQWYINNLEQTLGISIKLVPRVDAAFLKQGKFDEEVIKYLETQSGKVIVLTTYQTMSSGKNPDYKFDPVLENKSLRHVGVRKNNRTDIDYMYLEAPTNLLSVEDSQESKTSDRLLLLSNAMGLQEVGGISPKQGSEWAEVAISNTSLYNACTIIKKQYYHKSDDYLHASYRMIEQAVGRTARTEMKRETIYIAADRDLITLLANDSRSSVLFSHEYQALVKFAQTVAPNTSTSVSREFRRRKNLAILHTARSYRKIQSLLERMNNHSDSDMEYEQDWKNLRQFVLKNPTCQTIPIKNREYYVDSPSFDEYEYCSPKEEFQTNEYLFFENFESTVSVINESNSRLSILMKNKDIREHFESVGNEFCTEWLKGARYILTPPMYINIYLGALGEEAGKAVLVKQGFQFEDLRGEQFEKFDGILSFQNKKILIDFKYWDLSARRSLSEEEQKADMIKTVNKLNKFHINKLVICNIFKSNEEPILFFDENFKHIQDKTKASIMTIPNLLDEVSGQLNNNAITELARWMLT